MSKAEFQKLHDEIKTLKSAEKHEEFVKRFCTKDAIFMTPFHEPGNVQQTLDLGKTDQMKVILNAEVVPKVEDITQFGDVVIDRTSLTFKLPCGEKTGWSLNVWVKEDGQWKIRNTCTTFKMPPPSA